MNLAFLNFVTVISGNVGPSGYPVNLIAVSFNTTRIQLLFDVSLLSASGISVERSTDGIDYSSIAMLDPTARSYYDTTVVANTQYYYRLRAYKDEIYSKQYSNVVMALSAKKSTWDGTVGTTFDGGTGTVTNPYLISSAATFAYLASYVNAGGVNSGLYWKVTTDIDLNSLAWTPISNQTYHWLGTIDFDGHKIYNLSINRSATNNGIFGYIYTGSSILNGGIESGSVKGGNYTGGWTGDCYAATIKNCYNKANISAYSGTPQFLGGISGRFNSTITISNCFNQGNITSTGYNAGGLAGMQNAGNITNCYSTGTVSTTAGVSHGALLGSKSGGNIYHCYYDSTLCTIGAIAYADVVGSADGKSTADMKTESTFSTYWDMVVWEMKTGYPELTIFDDSPSYYIANGSTDRALAKDQVYAGVMMNNGVGYKKLIRGTLPRRTINNSKLVTFAFADFYTEDLMFAIPILAKYGFSTSCYTPTKFAADNPLNLVPEYTTDTNPRDYRRVLTSASFLSAHFFQHYTWGVQLPLMDGVNYPSNDDFRVARSDGTNAFGKLPSLTLLDVFGAVMCGYDYLDIASWQDTVLADMTDEQCQTIRSKLSYFYGYDYRFKQRMLQILDTLSNLYCGTTGYSVKNGDYATNTPNTASETYPSIGDPILGGIFQGATTLCNHEIWERFEKIFKEWTRTLGRDYDIKLMVVAGGWTNSLFYLPVNPPSTHIRYHDRECTRKANCFAAYTSSITGTTRCYADIMKSNGFVSGPGGYVGYAWTDCDGNQRKEKAVMYKLGSDLSTLDYLGDGYNRAVRILDYDLADDSTGFANFLASTDLMKEKFELTIQDTSAVAITSGNNFAQVINELDKRIAWGLAPEINEDLGVGVTNTAARRAHFAIVFELYCQYCKENGIDIVSVEEAIPLIYQSTPKFENIFPNSTLATTAKDSIGSSMCNNFPDGWDAGTVELEGEDRVFTTDAKAFTRTYRLTDGSALLTAQLKGTGKLDVYRIRNWHPYWISAYTNTSVCEYELIQSVSVDSETYVDGVIPFDIPIEPDKEYTTEGIDYQRYMRGRDNQTCGLHIELVPDTGKTITLKSPSLIIS